MSTRQVAGLNSQPPRRISSQQDAIREALERDRQAARYAAGRAQKQYDLADPENRLVAEELERCWNEALERVRELELRMEQYFVSRNSVPPATLEEFTGLAEELEEVWNSPQSDVRLKKRIVRALMHEVLVEVDQQTNEVIVVIHWQGGVHTLLRVPRRRRGNATRTATDIIEAVQVLAHVAPDKAIAGFLNRNNLKTGRGNRWTQERITSLRSYHQILRYCPDTREREGWLTLTEASRLLKVSACTRRLAAERNDIVGQHPLPDGPWVFRRLDLQTPVVQELVQKARQRCGKHPAVPSRGQKTLDFSGT